jgi:aromatic ring-opening dioxygenase catalytic subunit (LigB family)
MIECSHEGYVILGSGMAVHSFASIDEIRSAPTEEEREATRAKVLAESRAFDTHLREAVTKRSAEERKKALLKLEELYEFKRSHPTVEVRMTYSASLCTDLGITATDEMNLSTLRLFWLLLERRVMRRLSPLAWISWNRACRI